MEIKLHPGFYWVQIDGQGWPGWYNGKEWQVLTKDVSQLTELLIAGKLSDFPCRHFCICTQNPDGTWTINCG